MDVVKIKKYLEELGEPKFRIKQIFDNYYLAKFSSFNDMTNISKTLRQKLTNNFSYLSLAESSILKSRCGNKARLKLEDNLEIETVLLEYKKWSTVCVSTQVGCAMGCLFCATGSMGFRRNLSSEEIVDQIIFWKQKGFEVDRVVFMGMGEPFLNWQNVKKAIGEIQSDIAIGWRKMTISTVGIVKGIREFTNWSKEINLAISLHTLDEDTREKIMPSAKKNRLEEIISSSRDYVASTKRLLFFEYALMDGLNDSIDDANKLSQFINSNKLFFANIIKLNEVGTSTIRPSKRLDQFCNILERNRVKYSRRMSLGDNINGACGQLVS